MVTQAFLVRGPDPFLRGLPLPVPTSAPDDGDVQATAGERRPAADRELRRQEGRHRGRLRGHQRQQGEEGERRRRHIAIHDPGREGGEAKVEAAGDHHGIDVPGT